MAITITDKAAEKISNLIKVDTGDPVAFGLLIKVKSGGCTGLSYDISLLNIYPGEGYKKFEHNGVSVFVEPKSYLFINGMTLDYQESIASSGFVFNNPNAVAKCGCGESFSV